MRGMLDGTEPSAHGDHYHAKRVRNLPGPVQAHLPICIGGAGEQVTLKLVAKYGDMCNFGGTVEEMARKEEVLLRHCETVGRDPATIERTTGIGTVFIRDDPAEAQRLFEAAFARNRVSRLVDRAAGRHGRAGGREAGAEGEARLPAPDRRESRPTTTRSR